MEELDVNNYLVQQNLFDLFKIQLRKDFSSCSLPVDFINDLHADLPHLKAAVIKELDCLLKNSTQLTNLLYRIDINETQIKNYTDKNKSMGFEEILSELIIKRILQKVILKKKFSS